MRLRFAALLLLLLCPGLCHAAATTQPASTRPSLSLHGIDIQRNIPYVPGGDPAEVLDLYLPKKPSATPLPLIVWVHGGGWWAGSKAGCPAAAFLPAGYAAASVEYRFSRKAIFPAQIQDCQAAIRWLRANSKKYNLDPAHIGVWGASAGGHLVSLLGTAGGKNAFPPIGGNEDQSDRVQAVCDMFGPADFNTVMSQAAEDKQVKNVFKFNTSADPYSTLLGVPLASDSEKGASASPVHYVSKDNPPFLILQGTADALVPFAQSAEFYNALKNAGVDATLQRFPGSGHGGPAFLLPPVQKLIKAFFDKNLKQMDVKVAALPDSAVVIKSAPPPR
jgi:acetyl esterase/lipase